MTDDDWLIHDLVEDGMLCASCKEPFDDGSGSPRTCRACTSADASREEDQRTAEPPGCHDSLRMEFEP